MEKLVAIKVKIGTVRDKSRSGHRYPDFNLLRDDVPSWENDIDWSRYVDQFGGWHYDRISGHNDEDSENDSPRGVWLGLLLVPADFAEKASKEFPDQVSVLDDAEGMAFYEQRVSIGQPEIHEDAEVLNTIAAKRGAGISEDDDDRRSLDPDHPQPGRRRNKLKTWDGYKRQRGIEIDTAATQRLRNNSQR